MDGEPTTNWIVSVEGLAVNHRPLTVMSPKDNLSWPDSQAKRLSKQSAKIVRAALQAAWRGDRY